MFLKIRHPKVIHPFLFAIFPSIFLFSNNLGHVFFYQILLSTGFILFITYASLLILQLIIKENEKIGIIVSISLMLFFSYGHVFTAIHSWQINNYGVQNFHIHRYLILTWLIIFSTSCYLSLKTSKGLSRLTGALNFGALFLFFNPIIQIGAYEFQKSNNVPNGNTNVNNTVSALDIQNPNTLPDIYYLVPDGHASSKTLKRYFNYDNSDFTDFLIEKGFYIATESQANYMHTGWSLSSSMKMNYLPKAEELTVDDSGMAVDSNNPNQQNYEVVKILKSLGYKYVHLSSGRSHTDRNMFADINIKFGPLNEFLMILIPTTMLKIIDDKFNLLRMGLRDRTLFTFSKLTNLENIVGPKFVFAHIGVPHPPFVFGINGEMVPTTDISLVSWAPKEAYLNQLIFTQKKLKDVINGIIEKSKIRPIILIQSDHGPYTTSAHPNDGLSYPPNDTNIRERMGIINAFYLPGEKCDDLLYDSISPVNNFRMIFNCYFNTNFEFLDDLSFFSWKGSDGVINVTDLVKEVNQD